MNGPPPLSLEVWCCLSGAKALRTWRRTALWWAGWRRGGPVRHRRTAAARQWGGPTVWRRESADCIRNSGHVPFSCVHARSKNLQGVEKHSPGTATESPSRRCPGPSPASPWRGFPTPAAPSGPGGRWSPAGSWGSSCSAPAGYWSWSTCECGREDVDASDFASGGCTAAGEVRSAPF